MVKGSGRPLSLAVAGLLFISLLAACGGATTKVDPPARVTFATSYTQFLETYTTLGINDVDRAFAFCLGPNDPKPVNTPVPDPSGHSRAQVSCLDAGGLAAKALPTYKEVVTKFETATAASTKDAPINNARAAILKAHDTRIKLYEDAAAAVAKNDAAGAAQLAVRYKEIADLSAASEKAVQALSQPAK